MRRARPAGEAQIDPAPPDERTREPLTQAMSLGALYGTLNQVAPLVRLSAVISLLFGSEAAAGGVLWPMTAAVTAGLAHRPLHRLAGWLVPGDHESSSFHQLRLVVCEAMRAAVQLSLTAAAFSLVDWGACGVRAHPEVWREVLVALLVAPLFCAAWSVAPKLLRVEPREQLAMASGTHDLSTATVDELLRSMRPRHHMGFVVARCTCVALDVAADSLLFFVFLASAVQSVQPPSTVVYAGDMPFPAIVVAAFAYGSQHLRWRGEWLLVAGFAASLLMLCRAFSGSLVGGITAATIFAVFRYIRRSQDVRRFHAQ
ncbi:hypothetical protein AB1Y20_021652 [Prymnesium parvum]|uniref:Solute carrier family 40 protein n=1 Tax=Prymnesium parvum TaxID=97485 RepID=A0AB34JMW0_PRYPA